MYAIMKKIYRKPISRAIDVEFENLCIDSSLSTYLRDNDEADLDFKDLKSEESGDGEDALAPTYRTVLWGD